MPPQKLNLKRTTRTAQERTLRKIAKSEIRREAQERIAELRGTPTGKAFYAPRVIVAIVLTMLIVGLFLVGQASRRKNTNDSLKHYYTVLKSLNALATALGRYKFHVGEYPPTQLGLEALIVDPKVKGWRGPYIIQMQSDPWDTPYFYELTPSNTVTLLTCGPDKKPWTHDDLFPDSEAFDPGTDWTNGWLDVKDRLPKLNNPRDNWAYK